MDWSDAIDWGNPNVFQKHFFPTVLWFQFLSSSADLQIHLMCRLRTEKVGKVVFLLSVYRSFHALCEYALFVKWYQ